VLRPTGPTEFERCACRLGLTESGYATSSKLRKWCEHNRHRCYVPEWLLAEWDLLLEPGLSE
jgi:hypothetical protein